MDFPPHTTPEVPLKQCKQFLKSVVGLFAAYLKVLLLAVLFTNYTFNLLTSTPILERLVQVVCKLKQKLSSVTPVTLSCDPSALAMTLTSDEHPQHISPNGPLTMTNFSCPIPIHYDRLGSHRIN